MLLLLLEWCITHGTRTSNTGDTRYKVLCSDHFLLLRLGPRNTQDFEMIQSDRTREGYNHGTGGGGGVGGYSHI